MITRFQRTLISRNKRNLNLIINKRFSSKNEIEVTNDKEEGEENSILSHTGYAYDMEAFKEINSPALIEKLEREDKEAKKEKGFIMENLKYIAFMGFGISLINYLWGACPYTILFKHLTISEYTLNKGYLHSIFLGSISINDNQRYWALMIPYMYSISVAGRKMGLRHFAALYFINTLATFCLTYAIKKYHCPTDKGLLFPTTYGSVTPLSVISAAITIFPNYRMFGVQYLPFALIAFGAFAYELRDWLYEEEERKELCRPAHILSIAIGVAYGMYFRRRIFYTM